MASDNMQDTSYRKIAEVVEHAWRFLADLPFSTASEATLAAYRAVYDGLAGNPECLKQRQAKTTFYWRRAAVQTIAREKVTLAIDSVMTAADQLHRSKGSQRAVKNAAVDLAQAIATAEPMVDFFKRAALDVDGPLPFLAKKSKKDFLGSMPVAWLDTLWANTPLGWPYRAHLAAAILIPSRVADWAPGTRGEDGYCHGLVVRRTHDELLTLRVIAAKGRGGSAGTGPTEVDVDPQYLEPAAYLFTLCELGVYTITMDGDRYRAAVRRLGTEVFSEQTPLVTPTLVRAQVIADLKATFGAGKEVAACASQGDERSQSHYGYRAHGRARQGYIAIRVTRQPKGSHVKRAQQLAEKRAQRKLKF